MPPARITDAAEVPVLESVYTAPAPIEARTVEATVVKRAAPIEVEQPPALTEVPIVTQTATGRCEDGALTYSTERQGASKVFLTFRPLGYVSSIKAPERL